MTKKQLWSGVKEWASLFSRYVALYLVSGVVSLAAFHKVGTAEMAISMASLLSLLVFDLKRSRP